MARPRLAENQGLPSYLTFDVKNHQFRYRNPNTGQRLYLGEDREKAIFFVNQVNQEYGDRKIEENDEMQKKYQLIKLNLIEKVADSGIALSDFIEEQFIPSLIHRNLSNTTKRAYLLKVMQIQKQLGCLLLRDINVNNLADFLRQYPPAQSNRYHTLLKIIFMLAVESGLISVNPLLGLARHSEEKTRQSLTLDDYQRLHQTAGALGYTWMQNAMDICLLTGLSETQILNLEFSDLLSSALIKKEKAKVQIADTSVVEISGQADAPLQLICRDGSEAEISGRKIPVSPALLQVIRRCDDGIFSPYLIHRLPEKVFHSFHRAHQTKLLQRHFIKIFSLIRNATGLYEHLAHPCHPTFQEIRVLAKSMYSERVKLIENSAAH